MIRIQNLVKTFNKASILKGLNLEIMPEQRVALVGQNGCGKTTLIRCLLNLYQFEGDIEVFGTNIKENRVEALQKIAFVPQTPPSLKNTVKEIISLTSKLCAFPEERVHRVAIELGLDVNTCQSTPFKNLSGGMKQKLLIACALARRPLLLIMDEPSANLDPQARAAFYRQLSELPKETTMLLTSHRVDEMAGIVSRVIELDGGIITMDDVVEAGHKKSLIENQTCTLKLKQIPDSVKKTLQEWAFTQTHESGLEWEGVVASLDSFRFHATLTRWSGIIEEVSLKKMNG